MIDDKWSELHGNVEITGLIKYWIKASNYLAKPFIFLRLSPNSISILSVLISLPLIFNPESWWIVILALILDGIDGRVAIQTNRTSKQGAVIDSLSDRLVEFIWAISLHMCGINDFAIFTFFGIAWIQEYLRARAASLGFRGIGMVTIGERPTRAIFVSLALLITSFSNLILVLAVIIQTLALLSLLKVMRRELK